MNLNNIKYQIGKNLTFSQLKNRNFLKKETLKLKGKILDLGCGNGEYSFLLAKRRENQIIALDSSPELCGIIRQELVKKKIQNVQVVDGDAHHLPFPNDSFDACFCNTVLEHVNDPEQIVKEIKRVLKKNGRVIISCPFLQEIHADPYDFQRYTPYGLKNLLEKNSFKTTKIHCDYGALNVFEYLTLGSIVWRIRLGFRKNFPEGYVYIFFLTILFFSLKLAHLIFFPLQKKDKHFLTMVVYNGIKK